MPQAVFFSQCRATGILNNRAPFNTRRAATYLSIRLKYEILKNKQYFCKNPRQFYDKPANSTCQAFVF
jgi:hypothetical protein